MPVSALDQHEVGAAARTRLIMFTWTPDWAPTPTLPRMPTFTLGLIRTRTLTRTRWEPDCEEQDDVPFFLHSDGVRRR